MRCSKFEKYAFDYAVGDLKRNRKRLMGQHLKRCSNCKKVYQSANKLVGLGTHIKKDKLPVGVVDQIKNKLKKEVI